MKTVETTILKKKSKPSIFQNSIPTGSDLLDEVVGGGESFGYPIGKIINLVGDKSTGKTFLACEIIAAAKAKYSTKLKWKYDDSESGFSFNTKKLYGFEIMPMNKKERIKSATVEDLYCNVRKFAEKLLSDQFGIYVVDSLDGVGSKENDKLADEQYNTFNKAKTGKEKGSYKMGKAKYLSTTFFPKLADLIESKNILLIIISQVRVNLDPFSFEKYSRAGGKAMDFYCHTVLWLAQVRKIKRKERAVGVVIKAKTTKSKTARPYRETFISLLFDYGIDNITSDIDFLYDFLTPMGMLVKNAKGVWEEDGPNLTRVHLIEYIEENNLQKELTRRTVAKWETIENSIKTNRKPKYQ